MANLGKEQERFSLILGKLILEAYARGYQIRMGDVFAKDGHMANSVHYLKLAADINLFKGGAYLTDGKDHSKLHDFWDSIGGAKRIDKDLNHYSIEFEGRR